jgi:iron complex transport system substrate-binding protein
MKNCLINKIEQFRSTTNSVVLCLLFALILISSCGNFHKKNGDSDYKFSGLNPTIAGGFRIYDADDHKTLELIRLNRPEQVLQRFYLIDREDDQQHFSLTDGLILRVPLESMVCLSATHLSYADALGLSDKIIGIAGADYLAPSAFKNLIEEGKIKDIGIGGHFKLEQLIALSPEVVIVTTQQGQSYDPLINAGLTVVSLAEHLENHPLGRAEWIKVFGLLFGKEAQAMEIFDSISRQYNNLKALTSSITHRPVVLSGKQYGGFWNLPGGKSYLAQMLSDAGAQYLWAADDETGSLMLDFETVYHRGIDADFWRFLVYSTIPFSYDQLLAEDERYAGLKAMKEKKVYFCNTFQKPYFQKGALEPHLLLADYVSIFHPHLLPDHQLVYYELLK